MDNTEQNTLILEKFKATIPENVISEDFLRELNPDKFIQYLYELKASKRGDIKKITIHQGEIHTPITEEIIIRGAEKLKRLHDYQYGETSEEQCPNCHRYTIIRKSKQTRRADEAATVYEYCLTCKFKRRE